VDAEARPTPGRAAFAPVRVARVEALAVEALGVEALVREGARATIVPIAVVSGALELIPLPSSMNTGVGDIQNAGTLGSVAMKSRCSRKAARVA
jgi:hypothetical protein